MKSVPQTEAPIVFLDDAHTFGGTQVALAWVIHVVLTRTSIPVLCVCTERTRRAIEEVSDSERTGLNHRLTFIEAPSALPLNIVSFPLRLFAYAKLLRRIREQPVLAWWLNLPDIEFCLAPLVVLRAYGEKTHAYLHGTACFGAFYKNASWQRRALSWLRDGLANRFAYRLHRVLVTPSLASQHEVQARLGSSAKLIQGHLYPPSSRQTKLVQRPSVFAQETGGPTISLWMVGGVVQGHKNNLVALDVLELLLERGYDATLTLAGTGPDLQQFQREARRRELSGRITYLGWLADPWKSTPRSAVVLIPSFHETMNIVAREAMRNGLRLVVSPIPVFYEWVPERFIAANFSREAFCVKLQEVCGMDAEEIATLYAGALARFSNEVFLEEFLRFTSL